MELCRKIRSQREIGQPRQNPFWTDLELQARQIGAETPVRARAEAR